jgi:ATP-dependent RNA helicase DDX19/DBP5
MEPPSYPPPSKRQNWNSRHVDQFQVELNNNIMDLNLEDKASTKEIRLLAQAMTRGLKDNNLKDIKKIQETDEASPLHSIRTFHQMNLKPDLLRGVYQLGHDLPSRIQGQALPMLLADPPINLIAQSQNGTGKTAAFVIAMLMRVKPEVKHPQVLCVAPTLELAVQIRRVIVGMAEAMKDVEVFLAVRSNPVPRGELIKEQIVVGTPGRLVDLTLKFRHFDLKKIVMFVLDEADYMIGIQGHRDQSIRIRKALSPACQNVFFSATFSKEVIEFAESIVSNPVKLQLTRDEVCMDNIKQYWIQCSSPEAKYQAIADIYGIVTIGAAIIFCRTRASVSWMAGKLCKDGHAVGMLSGELTVEERLEVLNRFREGEEKILIATNVLCRGIDVPQVTLVVNYDLPVDFNGNADYDTYLHRIGRSGRFGKSGLAVNLVASDKDEMIVHDLEDYYGKKIIKLGDMMTFCEEYEN